MLSLERLKYFIEVAKLEHVGRAAQKMSISPSVISQAIQVLEAELNCKLFIRENNRIRLTNTGRQLLVKAEKIIADVDQLSSDLGEDNSKFKAHYRIGGSHFLVNEILVPSFLKIKSTYPLVSAEFLPQDTGAVVDQLLRGQLDIGLVFTSNDSYNLEKRNLKDDRFVIAVRSTHPMLKEKQKQQRSLLKDFPAITFRTTTGQYFPETHQVLKDYQVKPRHSFFYSDDRTAVQLLLKTDGWALLPQTVADNYGPRITKMKLPRDWKAPLSISVIFRKDKSLDTFLQLLIESVSDLLAEGHA